MGEDKVWNYRIVKQDDKFVLAKAYYSDGKLNGYEPVSGEFKTLEELKGEYKLIMTAFDEEVLKFETK